MESKILIPHELPRTGQSTVYRAGDDADENYGWPGQGAAGAGRFRDNGDGTIDDFATGLQWVSDPLAAPGSPFDAVFATWNAAIDACQALDFAGHTDWRLPNVFELESIQDYGAAAGPPFIYPLFPNAKWSGAWYWSSTTHPAATANAVTVEVWGPGAGAQAKATPVISSYARPVRNGVQV